MRPFFLIIKKDLRKRIKSPLAIVVLLIIPFFMTTLLGLVFSPSDPQKTLPEIKVLVVDHDKNIASKFLIQAFENPRLEDMFTLSIVDEKKGRALISKGKASALLVIPEQFSQNILNLRTTRFELVKNPSQRFLPVIVEEFTKTFGIMVSGFTQIFSEELFGIRLMTEIPLKDISIASLTPFLEKSKQKIVSLQEYLDPILIGLKEEQVQIKGSEKPAGGFNIFASILPAISIMFLLFIIEIFMRDIIIERENKTLLRMMFSPLRPVTYIMAKIFSGWIMGILVYMVVVVAGIVIFDISWGHYLTLFGFVTITCLWIASFFALLDSFFKNRNQAGAINSPIIIVFSAFGGSMMPVGSMPGGFQLISHFTLNFWFIRGVDQINRGMFPLAPSLVLMVSGIILFVLAVRMLTRRIQA